MDFEHCGPMEPISLLAKWMPSINTSSKDTRELAKVYINAYGFKESWYRKALSKMRAYLNIVERKMSANKWSEIEYETVPSKANLNYANAFLKHDTDRRTDFLANVRSGAKKINAGTLQPHEIVRNYEGRCCSWNLKGIDDTLEELWKALPNYSLENTLVVRDGSGSMTSRCAEGVSCLSVATALAVYMAQHNSGAWKNKYITFSSVPKIVDIGNCTSLYETLIRSYQEVDCSNTDIYKTMKLILDTAVAHNMPQEEMPKNIVICSDMQFDGNRFNLDESLFETIRREFEEKGYKLPRMTFWNIDGEMSRTIPIQENEYGLILCSGFSANIMKMFISNEVDPYKILVKQINSKRYEAVGEKIKEII